MNISKKSRTTTALLAFFLGTLGVHRMYVGKTGTGILQLVLTLTMVLWFVSAIWVLIDFIIIVSGGFKDREGNTVWEWQPSMKA